MERSAACSRRWASRMPRPRWNCPAIQRRLQTAKSVSPERLQRAASVLEGVRVSSPGLATKVSALTSDLRNRLTEATKGRRAAIVRLDDSGKETARYPL